MPPRTAPITGAASDSVIVTCPEITACTDSPLPLYGTWMNCVPVFCLNSSAAIWNGAALDA